MVNDLHGTLDSTGKRLNWQSWRNHSVAKHKNGEMWCLGQSRSCQISALIVVEALHEVVISRSYLELTNIQNLQFKQAQYTSRRIRETPTADMSSLEEHCLEGRKEFVIFKALRMKKRATYNFLTSKNDIL